MFNATVFQVMCMDLGGRLCRTVRGGLKIVGAELKILHEEFKAAANARRHPTDDPSWPHG